MKPTPLPEEKKNKKWSRKGNCPICGVSTGSYHNDKKHKGIQTLNSDFLKGQSMGYKKGWEDGMKVMEKTILQVNLELQVMLDALTNDRKEKEI